MRSKALTWAEVYQAWQSYEVSPPNILKFDKTRHKHYEPWVDASTQLPHFISSNPEQTTAFHLIRFGLTQSTEIFAAYALRCMAMSERYCRRCVIDELEALSRDRLEKLGVNVGWERNSKYVIPSFKGSPDLFSTSTITDVSAYIEFSALYWKALGGSLSLLVIPDWLEAGPETEEWRKHLSDLELERERREYERLKGKFEEPL